MKLYPRDDIVEPVLSTQCAVTAREPDAVCIRLSIPATLSRYGYMPGRLRLHMFVNQCLYCLQYVDLIQQSEIHIHSKVVYMDFSPNMLYVSIIALVICSTSCSARISHKGATTWQ